VPDASGADKPQEGVVGMRALRGCLVSVVLVMAIVSSAASARAQTVDAFGAALKNWAEKEKVDHAFVVVRHAGKIVYAGSVGGADPKQPTHLASLSKAITAACVATLVRDGKLSFNTTVATALAKFEAANGKPADARLQSATVGQLITHRAGFPGREEGDPISTMLLNDYLKTNTAKEPPKPGLLAAALKVPLSSNPGAVYAYSNTGYAVLGAIIEEASGKPYATYCRDAVLTPVGATGSLDPTWAVMAAYGGWRLTGEDYLKFFDVVDPAGGALGATVAAWAADPTGKSQGGNASWYALGTNTRKATKGFTIWHWGSWQKDVRDAKDGRLRASFNTYAVRTEDGTSWFVAFDPMVPDGPARTAIDAALFNAYRAVKAWP
jgi:CubicO group peptidase (beta-lactamase class C family)